MSRSNRNEKQKYEGTSLTGSMKKHFRSLRVVFKENDQIREEQAAKRNDRTTTSCLPIMSVGDMAPARIVHPTPAPAPRVEQDVVETVNGKTPSFGDGATLVAPRPHRFPVRRLPQATGSINSEKARRESFSSRYTARFKMGQSSTKLESELEIAPAMLLSDNYVAVQKKKELGFATKTSRISEDTNGTELDGLRRFVGGEADHVSAKISPRNESQPKQSEADPVIRYPSSNDPQTVIGEDKTSIRDGGFRLALSSKQEYDDGEDDMDARIRRITERTEELRKAAIAACESTVVLSKEEVARIDDNEQKCSRPIPFQSAKERRLERYKKLHEDGAPLAPRSMREKETRMAANIQSQHFMLRDNEPRPQPQQAQTYKTSVRQPHAQVHQYDQFQGQHFRKYHTTGKTRMRLHSPNHTDSSDSYHPKTRPQHHHHYKSMPRGGFAAMSFYKSQQYQPGPGFDQQPQHRDTTWTAPNGDYLPNFFVAPQPSWIPQVSPLPPQNFQFTPMMPHVGGYMGGQNWQGPDYSGQYSQPSPAASSHWWYPSDASNGYRNMQFQQGVRSSQSDSTGHIDTTGLWRPYQSHFVTEAASEGSRAQAVESGASNLPGTEETEAYREPTHDNLQKC